MRIIKRIPEEAYAYTEIHFDSLQEFESEYPKARASIIKANKEAQKLTAKNATKKTDSPF